MVKNVTLTLEEGLLEKARTKASVQHKTLNALFREWVRQYIGMGRGRSETYYAFMKKFSNVRAGQSFTRDQMNER